MTEISIVPDTPTQIPERHSGVGDGWFDWSGLEAGEAPISLVSESLARELIVFPARVGSGQLTVVMADPDDYAAIRRLEARSRLAVLPLRGSEKDILSAIDTHYSAAMPESVVNAMDRRFTDESAGSRARTGVGGGVRDIPLVLISDDPSDEPASENGPVIDAVDSLIAQASKARATDIHVKPLEDRVRVRFRIDGLLQEVAQLPRAAHGALLSRLKVMAGMDIAERRRPQDGQFSVRVGESSIDVRAASSDTVHGEMIVLRILNKSLRLFDLDDLGMQGESGGEIRRLLKAPYGMILVSGPTGAGKTTTLYAALNEMPRDELNIVTIEDPVEYRFEGINSIQINEKAGLSFPSILRAVLRLDPDVILVGEIRDAETASIAVQAALTGHLVLSSVHANDAVRAVSCLVDLGVEPFLLASALLGVVAQRMVRMVDSHCPVAYMPDSDEIGALGLGGDGPAPTLYKGAGCYFCSFTGYYGRTGLFEVLAVSDELRSLVMKAAGPAELIEQAAADGLVSMRQDGARKILEGVTTPLEVMRSVHTL